MRVVRAGLVVLGLALGACSDDEGDTTDGRSDATDAADTGQETTADTATDTAVDTAGDDTAADSAADSTADSAADTADDTAVDTAGDTGADTAVDSTEPDTADTTAPDTSVGVTWTDVYDIFAQNCSPCHTNASPTGGAGGHSIASTDADTAYAASQLDADIAKCAGKKIGECALIRIRDGSMPASGDCSREPPGPKCPDVADQALIEAWIDGGMLR